MSIFTSDLHTKLSRKTLSSSCPTLEISSGRLKNITLKVHQKRLLYAMTAFETSTSVYVNQECTLHTRIGVLADKVGAGKSFCILELLCQRPRYLPPQPSYSYTGSSHNVTLMSPYISSTSVTPIPINVLVVPHHIFHQWQQYIEMTDLHAYFISKRKHMIEFVAPPFLDITHSFCPQKLEQYELFLVSSTMFKDFAVNPIWKTHCCSRLIIDEIDSIVIPLCPRINMPNTTMSNFRSYFTWYITATYETLFMYDIKPTRQYHMPFMRNFVTPYIILRNEDTLIDASFQLPEIHEHIIRCKGHTTSILNGLVSQEIFQQLCAGNHERAIELLGYETITEQNVIQIVCDKLYTEARNIDLEIAITNAKELPSHQKQQLLEKASEKQTDILARIELIRTRLQESILDPITFTEIEHPVITKCCQNKFDRQSIMAIIQHHQTLSPTCPLCRSTLTTSDIVVLTTTLPTTRSIPTVTMSPHLSKEENLKRWFQTHFQPTSKYLIFAQWDDTWKLISTIFQQELHLPIHQITGSASSIRTLLQEYKSSSSSINILFLDAQHHGAGLNLEHTDHLLLFHGLHSSFEKQVIGRCQRPGRTSPLHVWKLLYEMEEIHT